MGNKKFNVRGWIQVTIPIDQIVEATDEKDAKRIVYYSYDFYCNNLNLTCEEIIDHESKT